MDGWKKKEAQIRSAQAFNKSVELFPPKDRSEEAAAEISEWARWFYGILSDLAEWAVGREEFLESKRGEAAEGYVNEDIEELIGE